MQQQLFWSYNVNRQNTTLRTPMSHRDTCLSNSDQKIIDLQKWQHTVDLMSELFGATCGTIVQLRENEFNVVVASHNKENFLKTDVSWPWEMKSFCRTIMETKQNLYVNNAKQDDYWKDAPPVTHGPVESYCGLPIYWPNGELFGTICVIDTKPTSYPTKLLNLLEQFSNLIMSDLKVYCHYQELQDLALTDELTGLNNRRGLHLLGEQRVKDAKRARQTIGVIYLDIDKLKQVNDQHGHCVGDECIQTVAKVLSENCRESDIVVRMGGDEFVIMSLFNDEDGFNHDEQLEALCQRLIKNYHVQIEAQPQFGMTSLSYGQKTFNHNRELTIEEMIEQTDHLMYQNKNKK